jgi:hypothetical protein
VPAVGELAEISVEASSLLFEIPAKKKKAYSNIIRIFLSAGTGEFKKKVFVTYLTWRCGLSYCFYTLQFQNLQENQGCGSGDRRLRIFKVA